MQSLTRESLDRILLSDHFTAEELCHSDYAVAHNIDNTPNLSQLLALKMVTTMVLERVRVHYDRPMPKSTAITSGLRVLELNRALGSKDTSQHLKGEAIDFKVPTVSNYAVVMWILANLQFDQLILEKHGNGDIKNRGWIHCSYVDFQSNRNQVLTYDGNEYRKGLHLYD